MRAFLWRDGSATELPGLGGPTSSAEDLNQSGQVVGHADNEEGYPRAVIWRPGWVEDLGTLGGDDLSDRSLELVRGCRASPTHRRLTRLVKGLPLIGMPFIVMATMSVPLLSGV